MAVVFLLVSSFFLYSEDGEREPTKSPTGAVLRSLALPGWGQLYTENYWKAPVFAAGAGVLWYEVVSNHINYADIRKQLDAIEDKNSYEYTLTKARLNNAADNRDLMGLYLLGVYVLSMVDAYSDAHLYDFSVSDAVVVTPNLSYGRLNLGYGTYFYPTFGVRIGIR